MVFEGFLLDATRIFSHFVQPLLKEENCGELVELVQIFVPPICVCFIIL